jgi:asparagine synthase (glutamine-hydrolysing)
MCGVAGTFHLDGAPSSARILQRMTDSVRHRGPDDEGHFVDGACGLGHRRLSIIDLSKAGHQPMMTADGRFVLSYNGEIYNYRELRLELEAHGYVFRSATDTEVLLQAFAKWGKDAVSRLNGMFAFAIYDRTDRKLYLVRDRYGVKPLYVAKAGSTVVFGSEVKAILASGLVEAKIDLEGLCEYLTFQNFLTSNTLFKQIEMVPAGTILEVSEKSGIRQQRYWDFSFRSDDNRSTADLIEDLDHKFIQAVNRQLVADVPLGTFLSGGMDTGAITAIAASQIPNMCSFTVGFDLTSASGLELGFDERAPAERMSYLFGTEHYEMVLKAGDMQRAMSNVVWHVEEPRVGQSYPNYYAAKLASGFTKVVLSGTGGDELFAGYPWRYFRHVESDSFDHYIHDYYGFWQRLIPDGDFESMLSPIWPDVKHVDRVGLFRGVFSNPPKRLESAADYANHSLYFEAKTFLHGVLAVDDKLSMAHSIESRVPFLDNDLVDLASRIPIEHKLARLNAMVRLDENAPGHKGVRYFQKTNDGKQIMRELMRRHVPAEIVDGVKQGFSAPDASWFRGESIDYVRGRLMNRDARIFDFLDRTTVQRALRAHLDGRENRRLLIWSMLYLEEFLTCFFSSEGRMAQAMIA